MNWTITKRRPLSGFSGFRPLSMKPLAAATRQHRWQNNFAFESNDTNSIQEQHTGEKMKVIIVGGVAGGAARLRRLDEHAEILMVERGPHVSYANCHLP